VSSRGDTFGRSTKRGGNPSRRGNNGIKQIIKKKTIGIKANHSVINAKDLGMFKRISILEINITIHLVKREMVKEPCSLFAKDNSRA